MKMTIRGADLDTEARILDNWWTIESLNSPKVPERNERKFVTDVGGNEDMPWLPGRLPEPEKGRMWVHCAYLGLVRQKELSTKLYAIFGEAPPPTVPLPTGDTCLAAVMLNEYGVAAEFETSSGSMALPMSYSHLPWSVCRIQQIVRAAARKGADVASTCEAAVVNSEAQVEPPESEKGFSLTIQKAGALVEEWGKKTGWIDWTKEQGMDAWHTLVRIHSYQLDRPRDDAEVRIRAPLINSFFLEDIKRAADGIKVMPVSSALRCYIGGGLPAAPDSHRIDVTELKNQEVLLDPVLWPAGAWPHKHGQLVLSQQVAINSIFKGCKEGETLFGVNGPPGTGKTTLLGDLIAAVVTERARAIATFRTPSAALVRGPGVECSDGVTRTIARFHESLLGFEIVVASANNAAVENVTRELPSMGKVDDALFAGDLGAANTHFLPLARQLLKRGVSVEEERDPDAEPEKIETWGAISAVLGNSRNNAAYGAAIQRNDAGSFSQMLTEGAKDAEKVGLDFAASKHRFEIALAKEAESREQARHCRECVIKLDTTLLKYEKATAARNQAQTELTDAAAARQKSERESERADILFKSHEKLMAALQERLDWCGLKQEADAQRAALLAASEKISADGAKKEALLKDTTRLRKAIEETRTDLSMHLQDKPFFLFRWLRLESAVKWEKRKDELNSRIDRDRERASENEKETATLDVAISVAERERALREHSSAGAGRALATATRRMAETAESFKNASSVHKFLCSEPEGPEATVSVIRQHRPAFESARSAAETARAAKQEAESRHGRAQARVHAAESAVAQLAHEVESLEAQIGEARDSRAIIDNRFRRLPRTEREQLSPWLSEKWKQARIEVFLSALALHRAFVSALWGRLRVNVINAVSMLYGKLGKSERPDELRVHLWTTLSLITPVVSTTFASLGRLFDGFGSQSLGWLIVDESGQATPQMAVGGIWRAKKAVCVGDPMQIEPVVTLPPSLLEHLRENWKVPGNYVPGICSVQRLADSASRCGGMVGPSGEKLWAGAPLVVHRRCVEPMFSVANSIAYENAMVQGRNASPANSLFGPSCWVHLAGAPTEDHWVEEECQLAVEIAHFAQQRGAAGGIYFISPFRGVAEELVSRFSRFDKRSPLRKAVGTVHTFQGKENKMVVLVMGGGSPGAYQFATRKPNLLNVALTRAKDHVYVLGNAEKWARCRLIPELLRALDTANGGVGLFRADGFRSRWAK